MATFLQRKQDSDDIEIKDDVVKGIVKPQLDELKTSMETSMDTKLKPMMDFLAEQKAAKDEAARQAAARARKEATETDETDWIVDPKGAMEKTIAPLKETIQAQSALIVRNETLSKMDYYSSDPAFKAKVDSLIDSQPLSSRANAAVVMNAYKTVVYDHMQDIKDGKIKSQASLASNGGSGTGNYSGSRSEQSTENEELSTEEKMYAKKLGISEKDWNSTKKELEYV